MRCDVAVDAGGGTLESTGMLDGWRVVGTMVGTCGVLEDARAPPERRLRRIWVNPEVIGRLWETED